VEVVPPGALGVIHGDVGALHHVGLEVVLFAVHGDADAGGDEHFLVLQGERTPHDLQDLARDHDGIVAPGQLAEHDGELVAAEPRHRIHLADAAAQPVAGHA